MTWKNVQLPLSSDEIRQIIENCSAEAVLVGGQALALWSQVYRVPLPSELSSGISADIDFIGSLSEARTLGNALNRSGGNWKLHPVTPGDSTPQTAKLSLTVKDEGYKEIDFLWSIVGVDTDQAKKSARSFPSSRRAVESRSTRNSRASVMNMSLMFSQPFLSSFSRTRIFCRNAGHRSWP
jgi:hypothetical protein